MKNFSFNDSKMTEKINFSSPVFLNQKDLLNFFSTIFTDFSKSEKIHVVEYSIEDDPNNAMMTTIRIIFQSWKKNELGRGTSHTWKCYRATTFACSNTEHFINQQP
jgi:hypothetical protein